MKIRAVWFAYPKIYWDTEREQKLIKSIRSKLKKCYVETANVSGHEKSYRKWKKDTGNGMQYYFKCVLPRMDAGVYMPFEDGMFGAGAYEEAEILDRNEKSIYEINLRGKIKELVLDESRRLSIDDTRKRYIRYNG